MIDSTDPASGTVARARSQGGYILATVLGLMVLSLMLLAALLAVTQSTMRIEQTGRIRERQARAAESAVQVAINQVRNSATVATAKPLNRKQAGDPGYLVGQPSFKQPVAVPGDAQYTLLGDPNINRAAAGGVCIPPTQLIDVDGYPVRIFCYPQGMTDTDQNGNKVDSIPQDDGAVAVRLVGDTYQGDTSNPGLVDVAANWKTSFPFSSAMSGFNQAEVNSTKGQLLYTGSVPLKIVGGVQVRNQIAAVANSGSGPALDVQGAARQGGKGMFDAGTGPLDCGIAKDNDPNNSPRADVKVDSLFALVTEGLQCNQADMASMAKTGVTPPNGEWDNARVQDSRYMNDWAGNPGAVGNGTFPSSDCASVWVDSKTHQPAYVIPLAAGAYDARATAMLNYWWSGGCPNRTWIFEGGDYWFDVNDVSKPTSDPARNSLVFNDRTSNWVFGPPVNSPVLNPSFPPSNAPWSVENFPKACDTGFASGTPDTSRGTSITLSSRTGLYHRAGRVAVCGPIGLKPAGWDSLYSDLYGGDPGQANPSRNQSTAIFQRPAVSLGARLLPSGLTLGDFGPAGASAGVIRSDDSQVITTTQTMPNGAWDGNHTYTKSFTATGLGVGAGNAPYPGPSPVSSVWVDVTGGGDNVSNANADLTKTRLDVTLADGTPCWAEYGPNRSVGAQRLPSNNVVTSYNLLDPSASGNCKTVLGSSTSRDQFYKSAGGAMTGTSVKVTFTLNPPFMRNTKFSWWDWWPWWRDHVVIPACNALNAVIDWFNYTIADIIKWYAQCDDRPSQVTYSVNSIAMRLGWSPTMGTPVNASDPPPLNPGCPNCIAVQNAANAARVNADGSLNQEPTYPDATINMPIGFPFTGSFSQIRYQLDDPTLLDGFLPLQKIDFGFKITKRSGFQGQGGADNNDSNVVQFTLKENIDPNNGGIWCRKTVRIDQMNGSVQTTASLPSPFGTLKPTDQSLSTDGTREVMNGCIHKLAGPGMTVAVDGSNWVKADEVEVGNFVSHHTLTSHGDPGDVLVPHYLDVGVLMSNRGTNKVLAIDFVNVSATAGQIPTSGPDAGNVIGYPRPLDPFTVTWSPLTPNPGGDGAIGDATFNVWGSVSVPNNDVRVIWNYDQSRYAGQTGFPMFNSGKMNLGDCTPIVTPAGAIQGDPSHCKPALVAAALGSWTTMTNNGNPVPGNWPTLSPGQLPDPLASTGNLRLPIRQVQIQACIVDSTGSGVNGDLLPRVVADLAINDRNGQSAVVPGASVWIKQWQSLRAGAFEPTADALTNDCATSY